MKPQASLVCVFLCTLVVQVWGWKVFEAESAHKVGNVQHTSTHKGGHVDFHPSYTDQGRLIFSVVAPIDNFYPLQITFTSGDESVFSLHANGHSQHHLTLPSSNHSWTIHENKVWLRHGLNTLSLHMETRKGSVRMDHIKLRDVSDMAARGATQSFYDIEAENAVYNGVLIGPSRTYKTIPSESSGRQAVQILGSAEQGTNLYIGQNIDFTLTLSANAMIVRYSIPDSSDGTGLYALLEIQVNGSPYTTLNITSKYAWVYGVYPFTNIPSQGDAHHFYDDSHLLFSSTYPAGTTIRLVPVTTDITFTIDLVSFYTVPAAYTMPTDGTYISITSSPYNADPSGNSDSATAISSCIRDASSQGKVVWIPQGKFLVRSTFTVNSTTIRGAGPWYSILFTDTQGDIGFFGKYGSAHGSFYVNLYDFAIIGATVVRDDTLTDWGVGGPYSNSIFQNIWIEHTKVGMWFGADTPYYNNLITGVTVRNTMADGINLYRGANNVLVEQCIIRNTGDDCLAMYPYVLPNVNSSFRFNTVGLPILANAIAVYGGTDSQVTDNIVTDVVCEGGAFQIGNRYNSVPLAGTTIFARNTAYRGGAWDRQSGMKYGGFVFWPENYEMNATVLIDDISLYDSTFSGILFVNTKSITGVYVTSMTVDGLSTYVIEVQSNIAGSAYVANLHATNVPNGGTDVRRDYSGCAFGIQVGPGNSGWDDTACSSFVSVTTSIPSPATSASAASSSASTSASATVSSGQRATTSTTTTTSSHSTSASSVATSGKQSSSASSTSRSASTATTSSASVVATSHSTTSTTSKSNTASTTSPTSPPTNTPTTLSPSSTTGAGDVASTATVTPISALLFLCGLFIFL